MKAGSGGSLMRVEVHIALRILGDDLEPERVSATLGLQADRTHRKGDAIGKRSRGIRRQGYWEIDSEPHVPTTEPFERHAAWLLDRIEPVREQLHAWSKDGWLVDLWVGAFTDAGHGGPVVGPEILLRLGNLGLVLNLDLYPNTLDEEA